MTVVRPEVFIVDDDDSVRPALARLLKAAGHTAQTFASAGEFLESQGYLRPGCLLLDLQLPDLGGMELYERLTAAGASMPVIFLTGFGDIPTTVRAMKSGALDFLPKSVTDEELLRAVDAALAEDARLRADRSRIEELARRFDSLTPREGEVMRLVLAGKLNKQIGFELGISERTVKIHRGRVMAKLGVRHVAQLVELAVRAGLVAGTSPPATSSATPSDPGAAHTPRVAPAAGRVV